METGIFDDINNASPTGWRYIKPGTYFALIQGAKITTSGMDDSKGFCLELKILASEGGGADEVGAVVSDLVSNSGKSAKMFKGTVKAMLMGILGIDDEAASDPEKGINAAFMANVLSDDQPLSGRVVEIEAFKKNAEKDYVTKIYKRTVPEEEVEEKGLLAK